MTPADIRELEDRVCEKLGIEPVALDGSRTREHNIPAFPHVSEHPAFELVVAALAAKWCDINMSFVEGGVLVEVIPTDGELGEGEAAPEDWRLAVLAAIAAMEDEE